MNEEAEVGEDIGVERLLRLLWLFRQPGRTRTSSQVEDCGYPQVTLEGSTGRKNFSNDRTRLATMDILIEQTPDKRAWQVTGNPADVFLALTPAERDALTTARILVADEDAAPSAPTTGSVPACVAAVMSAISDGHPVRFTYNDTTRFVDPVSVVVDAADRWCLQGIDRDLVHLDPPSDAARTYRMDRISDAETVRTHTIGTIPADATWSLHPASWHANPPVRATIRLPHAPVPEWLAILGGPPATSTEDPDGTVVATFDVSNHTAFVRRSLLIGADVLAPPELCSLAASALDGHLAAFGVQ